MKSHALWRGVIVAVVLWTVATVASAAPFFYNEVERDGRIYVFSDSKKFELWQASGELGQGSVSRVGYGPNRETVVFDSREAVNLYNFKHDLPGEVVEVPEPKKEEKKFPAGKFSGLMFGDLYDFGEHHDEDVDGEYGFWFRRIYFTYDLDLSPKIMTRFRIEANSNGKFEGGGLDPYVKDAYVRWTYAGKHQMTVGIQPTVTFDWAEGFWGLRHIEKTPADLYRIDSSRDFGVKFSGPLPFEGLTYGAQWGNDSGQASEIDEYKAWRLEGRYDRGKGIGASVVYIDSNRDADADRETWSAFLGYRRDTWRVGGNYLTQERQAADDATDPRAQDIDIWSVFGVWEFLPKKASVFARYDDVTGDKDGETTGLPGASGIDYWLLSSDQPFQTYIVGGEWYVLPNLRIGPNIELAKYDDDPDPVDFPGRDQDRIYRVTFYWSW